MEMKAEVYAECFDKRSGRVVFFGNQSGRNVHRELSCLSVMSRGIQKGLEEIARLFGRILEREINVRQMLHLVHAQLAFSALILLGGISVLVAVLLMVWFVLSVVQCVRSM